MNRVLQFGDGVIFPYRSPVEIRTNVSRIKEEASKIGKDLSKIEIAQTVFTCIGRTNQEAQDTLTPTITVHARGFDGKAMSTDEASRHKQHQVSTGNLMQMSLVGTTDQIIKGVERFREAGLQHFVLAFIFRGKDTAPLIDNLKMFAKDVIPSFR